MRLLSEINPSPFPVSRQKPFRKQAFPPHKHNLASLFKLHNPLRHKGYNALRRCLRVRQNPPAYTTIDRAISFPCHCKTVIGFGSPVLVVQPTVVEISRSIMVAMYRAS